MRYYLKSKHIIGIFKSKQFQGCNVITCTAHFCLDFLLYMIQLLMNFYEILEKK